MMNAAERVKRYPLVRDAFPVVTATRHTRLTVGPHLRSGRHCSRIMGLAQ